MTKLLYKLIRLSGLAFLFREFLQKNRVSILMFHNIGVADADRTFRYLTKHYNIVGLDDYIRHRNEPDLHKMPAKSLVITFDDGWRSNYDLLPLIKKYKIPVTIFLCAGIIDTNRHFWFAYPHLSVPKDSLKKIPNFQRLQQLDLDGFHPEREFPEPLALDKAQIMEMKPWVNFQAHTLFHPCLPQCSYAEARKEIFECKQVLEEQYGLNINALAFPHGFYGEREIALAKEAGYESCLTVDYGFNTAASDLFRLARLSANDTPDLNELIAKSSGFWKYFKTMLSNLKAQTALMKNKIAGVLIYPAPVYENNLVILILTDYGAIL